MKAARLYEYDPELEGQEFLKVEEVPEPEIEAPDDVIVRVGGAGVCRTDLHIIEGLWDEALVVEPPYTLGHENAGWVEEAGSSVSRFAPGDAVVIQPALSDGTCLSCLRGRNNLCESLVWIGIQQNGGFAEYVRVKERNLVKLPENVEPRDAAPYADAGLTAYHATKKAARVLDAGDVAVVIGIGGLGHIGVQVLKALSPARVVALDRSEGALRLAEEVGADHVVNSAGDAVDGVLELTGGRGAQAVVDFVGEADVPARALAMTRTGGYYFVVGYGGEIRVPTMEMIATEKSIVGNIGGTTSELHELIALAGEGKVRMNVRHYPLEEANRALLDLHEGRIHGRGVLVP